MALPKEFLFAFGSDHFKTNHCLTQSGIFKVGDIAINALPNPTTL
jgi:hypothetical protein